MLFIFLTNLWYILLSFIGMKNREERSKHFFDSGPLVEEDEDIALYDRVRLFYKYFCF